MRRRKAIGAVLLLPTLALCLVLGVAAFDPLGVLWRTEPKVFALGMRYMAACAIDSGRYDSYVLGTSMLENTSARELERLFPGSSFANVSLSSSSFTERALLLGHMLSKEETRRVVYSLDDRYLEQKTYVRGNFACLYDDSLLNNIEVYFDVEVFREILKDLRDWTQGVSDPRLDGYDMPTSWYANLRDRFGGLDKWLAARKGWDFFAEIIRVAGRMDATAFDEKELARRYAGDIEKALAHCDKYLFDYVRAHPETDFYLVFPPYSRIRQAMWYQADRRNAVLHRAVVRRAAGLASECPNLRVFGYEDETFLDDIALYLDTYHYHPDVNRKISEDMAEGRHLLTPDNVEAYLAKSREAALACDLKGLARMLDDFLKSRRGKKAKG